MISAWCDTCADEVALLYLGKIVEVANTEVIFEEPKHPYTQALISAIPDPDPDLQREEIIIRRRPVPFFSTGWLPLCAALSCRKT